MGLCNSYNRSSKRISPQLGARVTRFTNHLRGGSQTKFKLPFLGAIWIRAAGELLKDIVENPRSSSLLVELSKILI